MLEVERAADHVVAEPRSNVRVGEEVVEKGAFSADRFHGVALNEHVRLLAGHPRLDEREKDRFAEEEPAGALEISGESLGVHDEAVDQRARAILHERERRGRVGGDHSLDARVRDVALVPERDILERGNDVPAEHPRQPRDVLAEDRVSFVRHRRGALLPLREGLFGLADLVALPVPDVGREPLDPGADDRERGEEGGVPIARDHLRRHGLGAQPQRRQGSRFDGRRKVRVRADGPRDLSHRDLVTRDAKPRDPALRFGEVARQRDAKRDRLRVDAVRTPDHRRRRVLACPARQRVDVRLRSTRTRASLPTPAAAR